MIKPDVCSNYHRNNSESVAANPSASAKMVGREAILGYVKVVGSAGVTCDEVEVALNMPHQTVSARISELKRDNLLIKIGTRSTRTGSLAAVLSQAREVSA